MDIALTLFNLKFLPGVDVVEEPEQVEHVHRHQAGLQHHVPHEALQKFLSRLSCICRFQLEILQQHIKYINLNVQK